MGRAIVFPYVNLPDERWLVRTLLYWEQVTMTIPQSFIRSADSFTAQLIDAELVGVGGLLDTTLDRRALEQEFIAGLERKAGSRRGGPRRRMHAVKASRRVYHAMQELGLSDGGRWDATGTMWHHVEETTAQEWMALVVLAQSEQGDPVAQDAGALHALAKMAADPYDERRHGLRLELLEVALPVTDGLPPLDELLAFKAEHGAELCAFREAVEDEVAACSESHLPEVRAERLREARLRLDDRQRSILALVRDFRPGATEVASLYATVPFQAIEAAAAMHGDPISMAALGGEALRRGGTFWRALTRRPLGYAVAARRAFPGARVIS